MAYDISHPNRLRNVARTFEDVGLRRQYSVFLCRITPAGLVRLKSRLYDIINLDQDQVLSAPCCLRCSDRGPGLSDRAARCAGHCGGHVKEGTVKTAHRLPSTRSRRSSVERVSVFERHIAGIHVEQEHAVGFEASQDGLDLRPARTELFLFLGAQSASTSSEKSGS